MLWIALPAAQPVAYGSVHIQLVATTTDGVEMSQCIQLLMFEDQPLGKAVLAGANMSAEERRCCMRAQLQASGDGAVAAPAVLVLRADFGAFRVDQAGTCAIVDLKPLAGTTAADMAPAFAIIVTILLLDLVIEPDTGRPDRGAFSNPSSPAMTWPISSTYPRGAERTLAVGVSAINRYRVIRLNTNQSEARMPTEQISRKNSFSPLSRGARSSSMVGQLNSCCMSTSAFSASSNSQQLGGLEAEAAGNDHVRKLLDTYVEQIDRVIVILAGGRRCRTPVR